MARAPRNKKAVAETGAEVTATNADLLTTSAAAEQVTQTTNQTTTEAASVSKDARSPLGLVIVTY